MSYIILFSNIYLFFAILLILPLAILYILLFFFLQSRLLQSSSILVLSGLLLSSSIYADPWGKDADLLYANRFPCPPPSECRTPVLGGIAEGAIWFHQNVISPADGPRSHFLPSSSQYTLDAIRKYGFFQGFLLGCDRLMRENSDPWIYTTVRKEETRQTLKWNPVP